MRKRFHISTASAIFLASIGLNISHAQDYFPLEIGNTWVYDILMIPDTYDTTRITEKVLIRNKIYLQFESTFFYGYRWLRNDDHNNILEYLGQGIEDTLYKLNTFREDSWNYSFYTVTFGGVLPIPINTLAGDFEDCIFFLYESEEYHTFMDHYLAPDIGLVYLSAHNFGMRLVWAEVKGVVYPDSTGIDGGGNSNTPVRFALLQNVPNPFNASTDIGYQMIDSRSPIRITLKVYNVLGREVRRLVDEEKEPGLYHIIWDGRDNTGIEIASGIYWCRLEAGRFHEVRQMVLLR